MSLPPEHAPPGIPPALWAAQQTDRYVEPTNVGWPGAQAIAMDLPTRYTRRWRLVCEAITNTSENGGNDPLIAPLDVTGALPYNVLPAMPPTIAPPAALTSGIVMVADINATRVFIDYPARGAVYSIAANRFQVAVFQSQVVAAPGLLRPIRCHLRVQEGPPDYSWDRPSYTVACAPVIPGSGEKMGGAVPPRAVQVRIVLNDDTNNAAPVYPLPPIPKYVLAFWNTQGELVEERNGTNYPPPVENYDTYPVPTSAAWWAAIRVDASGGTWQLPRAVFTLSL